MALPFPKKKNNFNSLINNNQEGFWWKKAWRQGKKTLAKANEPLQPRGLLFEALEPRILLSADLSYGQVAADLTLHFDQQANQFQLLSVDVNGQNANVESRMDADAALTDGLLSIAGSGAGNVLRLDADSLPSVNISLLDSGANNTLFAAADTDFQLSNSILSVADKSFGLAGFNNIGLEGGAGDNSFEIGGWSGLVQVEGGGGRDTLFGPASPDVIWNINGQNGGTVGGVQFAGIENLKGAENNRDNFAFETGGSIAGLVDGGTGGFDTLSIGEGNYASAVFTASGPTSGTIDLDGNHIAYTGLEPLLLTAGVDDLTIFATGVDDDAVLRDNDNLADGKMLFESDFGTFESLEFNVPKNSLTIALGTGADTFNIQGALDNDFFAIPNTKNATTLKIRDPESVTLTTDINVPGDFIVEAAAALPITDPGLFLNLSPDYAGGITVAEGVKVTAGGDIRFSVNTGLQLTLASLTPVFKDLETHAAIWIGTGSELIGRNISLNTFATTDKYAGFDIFESDLLNFLAGQSLAEFYDSESTLTFVPAEGNQPAKIQLSGGTTTFLNSKDENGNPTVPFEVGDTIKIVGSANEGEDYTIAAITANEIQLAENNVLQAEVVNNTQGPPVVIKQQFTDIAEDLLPFRPVDRDGNPIDPTTGNIVQLVDASGNAILQDGANPIAGSVTSGELLQTLAGTLAPNAVSRLLGTLGSAIPVEVVLGHANSTVTIDTNVRLTATAGNVQIGADATSLVDVRLPEVRLPGATIGFVYVDSSATSRVDVLDGAEITATGDFLLAATTRHTMNSVVEPAGGASVVNTSPLAVIRGKILRPPGPSLQAAYGKARSNSDAVIADGATITAGGDVAVSADNNNIFKVSVDGVRKPNLLTGRVSGTAAAIGVAFSDTASTSHAVVDGKVKSDGDLSVNANSVTIKNETFARSAVRNRFPAGLDDKQSKLFDAITTKIGSTSLMSKPGIGSYFNKFQESNKPSSLGIAASVAFVDHSNSADASIGANAVVRVAGSLGVNALAEDNFRTVVTGVSKVGTQVSIGGGVAVTGYSNAANASIADHAVVDVGKVLSVSSVARVPNQVELTDEITALKNLDFNFSKPSVDDGPVAFAEGVDTELTRLSGDLETIGNLTGYLGTTLGVESKMATSYVAASAGSPSGSKFALSGSVDLLTIDNSANAWIGQALVNIDATADDFGPTLLPSLKSDQQLVSVTADAAIETINVMGIPSVISLFTGQTKAKGAAVGGVYGGITYRNKSRAYIADGAVIDAGDSTVPGPAVSFDPNAVAGDAITLGAGHGFTTGDAVLYNNGGGSSIGGLDNGRIYYVRVDDAAPDRIRLYALKADAEADENVIGLDGSTATGSGHGLAANGVGVAAHTGNFAINVSESGASAEKFVFQGVVNYSDFESEARAYIEDQATIHAANDVVVDARTDTFAVIVAGGLVKGGTAGAGVTVVINFLDSKTEAFIGNFQDSALSVSGSVTAGGDVNLDAVSRERIYGVSIAGTKVAGSQAEQPPTDPPQDPPPPPEEPPAEDDPLDGVSLPLLFGEEPPGDEPTGEETVEGVKGKAGYGLSGDASYNHANTGVRAYIGDNVTVNAGGDVTVQADHDGFVLTIAGAATLDFSKEAGGVAIAGSFTLNEIDRDVQAYVQDTAISAARLSVLATNEDEIYSITAGAGGSRKEGAAAVVGSANIDLLNRNTSARIGADTIIGASGDVDLEARQALQLISVAGGFSVSGKAGIGAAADVGVLHNTVEATIDTTVTIVSGGDVRVVADSSENIVSVGASLAVGTKKLGVVGSGASQTLLMDIVARVDGTVAANGNLLVDANDEADLIVVAGAGAFGKQVGFGVSIVNSDIVRDVEATIGENAAIVAKGMVDPITEPGGEVSGQGIILDATANDDVKNIVVAGAAARQSAALAGSVLVNLIKGEVTASIGSGATVTAGIEGESSNRGMQIRADHSADVLNIAGVIAANLRQSTQQGEQEIAEAEENAQSGDDSSGGGQTGNTSGTGGQSGGDTSGGSGQSVDPSDTTDPSGGGLQISFGASAAVAVMDVDVLARIDGAQVSSSGDVTLDAHSDPRMITLAVAGALAASSSNAGASGKGGLSFVGAAAGAANTVLNSAEALILDSTVTITDGGALKLTAEDDAVITADAGGVAIAVNQTSKKGADLSVGLSAALNIVDTTIRAAIDHSTVDAASDVTLDATSGMIVVAGALGGAFSAGSSNSSGGLNATGAGAGTANAVDQSIVASIGNGSRLSSGGAVLLTAKDDSIVTAVAGGVAIAISTGSGSGDFSVGLSAAVNVFDSYVRAAISESTVTANGDVDLEADSTVTVAALSLAGAVAASGSGDSSGFDGSGAGAGSGNTVDLTIEAVIDGNSEVTSANGGSVSLQAQDDSTITADAGGLSLGIAPSGSAIAIGAAIAVNEIQFSTSATIDKSTVRAAGSVVLDADSTADILAVAIGFGGSLSAGDSSGVALAGAGSGLGNTLSGSIRADIRNSSVASGEDLLISATDASQIIASGGALATAAGSTGLALAFGASVAVNTIDRTVTAAVDGSIVIVDGAVDIGATTAASILSITLAGGVSASGGENGLAAFGAAGAVSVSDIDIDTRALIEDTDLRSGAGLTLAADNRAGIVSEATGATLSVSASQGQNSSFSGALAGGIANNAIDGSVEAVIRESDPGAGRSVSTGGAVALRAVNDSVIQASAVGGSLGVAVADSGTAVSGSLGVGVATNHIRIDALAAIDGAIVTAGSGAINFVSSSGSDISAVAVAASLGVSASSSQTSVDFVADASLAVNDVANGVESLIGGGAAVTTSGALTLSATDDTSLFASVTAASFSGSIAAGSSASLAFAATLTASDNRVQNRTRAMVEDASVAAGAGFAAAAVSTAEIDAVAVAASVALSIGSGGMAVSGSGTGAGVGNTIANTIEAGLGTGSSLATSGPVTIAALDDAGIASDVTSASAAIGVGGNGAITFNVTGSVAVNEIDTETRAIIAGARVAGATPGTRTGQLIQTADSTGSIRTSGTAASLTIAGDTGGNIAVGVSVTVAVVNNVIDGLVEATIRDGSDVRAGAVTASATHAANIEAVSGSVAASVAISSGNVSVAVSGAAAVAANAIGTSVLSGVIGAALDAVGAVDITVTSASHILANTIAAVLSVSGSQNVSVGFGAAGATAVNRTTGVVEAVIRNATVTATGAVALNAVDESVITSNVVAASLSVAGSGGQVAVAISIAVTAADNLIDGTVRATIKDATVTGAAVAVSALSSSEIHAAGASMSLSVSVGQISVAGAGAGAGTSNALSNNLEAAITGSDVTATAGGVAVVVENAASITSLVAAPAGGVAVSPGGQVTVGISAAVAVAINDIQSDVRAAIDGSTANAAGAVAVTALNRAGIDSDAATFSLAVAAAGQVNVSVSLATTNALNDIGGTVEAVIRASALPTAGAVTVSAEDRSTIRTSVSSASISITAGTQVQVSIALDAVAADNRIGGTLDAVIEDSVVDAAGTVSVAARARTAIEAVGVAAAGSLAAGNTTSVAGAGSGAAVANETRNAIVAGIVGGTVTGAAVDVSASDDSTILSAVNNATGALAFDGTVAVTVSGSASVSVVDFGSTVTARILGATVTAKTGGVTVDAASAVDVTTVVTGFNLGGSGAGTVNVSVSFETTEATVLASNRTEALIDGGVVVARGSVAVKATDASTFNTTVTAAGIAAGGSSTASVTISAALSFAYVDLAGQTRAAISGGADVEAGGAIRVSATGENQVYTQTFGSSFAVGASGVAGVSGAIGAGTVAVTIAKVVDAHIGEAGGARTQVNAGGAVTVSARDAHVASSVSEGTSISATGGIGGFSAAISAAVVTNNNRGTTSARVANADVAAEGGDVTVSARSETNLTNAAAALALSSTIAIGGGVAGSAAFAFNDAQSTIEALVLEGSALSAADAVTVQAEDRSDADAVVVAVALDISLVGFGGGLGVARNLIGNVVSAAVKDSSALAGLGDVAIRAEAVQDVSTTSGVGAFASAAGASGATAITDLDMVVEAYARDATLAATDGAVVIDAASDHHTRSLAVGLAGSLVAVSVTVVVAEANIGGATRAFADGDLTVTANRLDVTADSKAFVDPDGVSVAITGGGAGSGAGVVATIDRETEAYLGARAGETPSGLINIDAGSGDVAVCATSDLTSKALPVSLGIGVAAVAAAYTQAEITGATLAYVGEATTLDAGSLTVEATTVEDADTKTVVLSLSNGGGVAEATAETAIRTETGAWIGARPGTAASAGTTTAVDVDGAVAVSAAADRNATSLNTGAALDFGAVAVTLMVSRVDLGGGVVAGMGGDVQMDAGSVSVLAEASNEARSDVAVAAVSLGLQTNGISLALAGAYSEATIQDSADTEAVVGAGVGIATPGAFTLEARTKDGGQNSASATAGGGAAGTVAAGVVVAVAEVGGGVRAQLDGDVASATAVAVKASGVNRADAQTVTAGLGVFSATGSGAVAKINGEADVVARIGSAASLTMSGALLVSATGDNKATASSDAGTGGLGAISASALFASVDGAVIAALDGDVNGASTVTVTATGKNVADAGSIAVRLGLIGGGGIGADAEIGSGATVEARVGAASQIATQGAVLVRAVGDNTATADVLSASIGGVDVQAMLPSATVQGAVMAGFDGTLGSLDAKAASLTVEAMGQNSATAEAVVAQVSILGGAGANAKALIAETADVIASIGEAATLATNGAVRVDARHQGQKNKALARTIGGSGGVFGGLAVMLSEAKIAGGVEARFDGRLPTATDLTVAANGGNRAETESFAVGLGAAFGGAGTGSIATITGQADVAAQLGSSAALTLSGALTVEASGDNEAKADSDAGSGGIFGVSGATLKAVVGGAVAAESNGDVVGASAVTVEATGKNVADAHSWSIGIGLFGGATGDADALIEESARVDALVGSAAEIAAPGAAVLIQATGDNSASAVSNGVGAGGISIASLTPDATMRGPVKAGFDGDLILGAGAVTSLTVDASSKNRAEAASDLDSFGLGGGGTATPRAIVSSGARTDAIVGATSDIAAPGSAILVRSTSDNRAEALSRNLVAGLVAVGTASPLAESNGHTEAGLLGDVRVVSGGENLAGADSVSVLAKGVDLAIAQLRSDSVGDAVSVQLAKVDATVASSVRAAAGGSIRSGGNVTVQALATTDADAASKSSSGGLVDVAVLDAGASVNPTVAAEVLAGADIDAAGVLTVTAEHGQPFVPFSDGTFNAATAVDTSADAITLGARHGLLTGDTVTYSANGNATLGGVGDGRRYGVITVTDTSLKLGAAFTTGGTSTAVDLDRDTLTFAASHHLQEGDAVVYHAPTATGGFGIGSLTDGARYGVHRIDDVTIKLIDPDHLPAPAKTITGGNLSNNTVTSAGHGFTNGQAVTYRAPAAVPFNSIAADVVGGAAADPLAAADHNNIYLGAGHGFQAGDEVIYTENSQDHLLPISGLSNGGRYFVIFDPAKPNEIQLADSRVHALGSDNGTPDDFSDDTPITPIQLTALKSSADQNVAHALRKVGNLPIGGLTDGVTYYVVNASADTFQLAATPGGSALALDPTDPLSHAVLTGLSQIGSEGVDLTSAGSGALGRRHRHRGGQQHRRRPGAGQRRRDPRPLDAQRLHHDRRRRQAGRL